MLFANDVFSAAKWPPKGAKPDLPSWLSTPDPKAFRPKRNVTARCGSPTSISAPAAATRRCWSTSSDSVECDTLYLVGDIVDGWRLRKGWYWPDAHNEVVRRVLKMAHARHARHLHRRQPRRDAARLCRAELRRDRAGARGGPRDRRRPPPAGDAWRRVRRGGALRQLARLPRRPGLQPAAARQPGCSTASAGGSSCPTGRCPSYLKKRVKNAVAVRLQLRGGGRARGGRARRRRHRLRAHPLRRDPRRSATSPTTTTATGWRAAPRWSKTPTGACASSTGPREPARRGGGRPSARRPRA